MSDFKEFRILYLACANQVQRVQKELKEHPFSRAQIVFYHDAFALAQDLPRYDADLILLDERDEGVEKSYLFEDFFSSLPFNPQEFHYTMRRVIVVLPRSSNKTSRAFQLGLANVRAVITDPENASELFFHALSQLYEFSESHPKASLCISGGGLEGYLYSLGVTQALEMCLLRKSCCDFDIFCGVSSGAILSASYAVGMSSHDLIDQANQRHGTLEDMKLSTLFDPAAGELLKRILGFAKSLATLDLGQMIAKLQASIPVGLFRGEKLKQFFENQIKAVGMEDHFSALKKELYIGGTDQDTGENVVFGEEPWRDMKISQAIRASTALPAFYLPEKINGHWFTDGQLTASADMNIAIRKGAGLVVYIDPMVACSSNAAGFTMGRGGYFSLIQAVKGLVQSRATSLLKHCMDSNPDVDFVVFRPTGKVMLEMAGNPMKYQIRTELIELGLNCTLSQILSSYDAMAHKLAKHGFSLKSKDEINSLASSRTSDLV